MNKENKYALKIILSGLFLIMFSVASYAEPILGDNTRDILVNNGVGLGSVIAVVTSWSRNKSILWAAVHALFSWIYVIYFAFTRHPGE